MSERFVRNNAANPMNPIPLPKQVPAKRALAKLPGRKIFYADTGGKGEAVVFLHPAATGDPKVWAYQQPVFAKAGYRVISYARRGYYKSDNLRKGDKHSAADDLNGLLDALAIEKAHIVSSAAGGSIAADFALSYPKRILSLAITSNYAGIRKGNIFNMAQSVRVKQWNEMPRWYREFSCSYIAANPRGLKAWDKLADHATKHQGVQQAHNFLITPQVLTKIKVPTLLVTGDADSSTPPSIMRMVAKCIRRSELVTVAECGHSIYWEHPKLFNDIVLDFIRRQRKRKR